MGGTLSNFRKCCEQICVHGTEYGTNFQLELAARRSGIETIDRIHVISTT